MSSQIALLNYLASLKLANQYLTQISCTFLMLVGNVSCILNLMVFTRKNLRKNPCSIYFIAFNITSFMYINFVILVSTLLSYNVFTSTINLGFCRFFYYMTFLLNILSPSFIILASIDRTIVTSRNARTRQRSTQRFTYLCIIGVTLFWSILHCHTFVLINFVEIYPGYYSCYFASDKYLTITSYYSLIIRGMVVPFLMAFFGLWTIKNIRSVGCVKVPVAISTTGVTTGRDLRSNHSKDRQLALMLLMEISIYMIFSLVLAIVLMYEQVTQYNVKSYVQIQVEILVGNVSGISNYIPFCVGCYLNLLVSKTFRNEVKKIFFNNIMSL